MFRRVILIESDCKCVEIDPETEGGRKYFLNHGYKLWTEELAQQVIASHQTELDHEDIEIGQYDESELVLNPSDYINHSESGSRAKRVFTRLTTFEIRGV